MSETTYTVQGMTCDHCAAAVTEEVGKLEGVQDVNVDVTSGTVTVSSAAPLARDAVREAVTEAGYQLAS